MSKATALASATPRSGPGREADVFAALTPTQMKVLQGVHLGRLNKQIAYDLGIAEATVKAQTAALMPKLKARNRTRVALAARRRA